MTDAEKLYARLDALRDLTTAITKAQPREASPIQVAEYYRACATMASRQSAVLRKLAAITQEKNGEMEMDDKEP